MAAAILVAGGATAQQKTLPPPPVKITAPKPPAPPAIGDFDDARRELDRAAAEMEQALRNIPGPPQPPRMEEGLLKKTLPEPNSPLAKPDHAAVGREMEQARRDMEQARVEQARALKQMDNQMFTLKPQMEAQMKAARADMDKARKDLDAYEAFVNGLAADGLISQSGYAIEYHKGKLSIDGKAQPETVTQKYQSFLANKEGLRITKNERGLNIQKN